MNPLRPFESEAPRPVAVATTPCVKLKRPLPRVRSEITSTLTTPKMEVGATTPDQKENIEQILTAGRHLLGLINEVLDIASIEAGRITLSVESVNADEAIREAIDLVRPLGRRPFDQTERANEFSRKPITADREIQDRALGRCAVERGFRERHLAHRIFFHARPAAGHRHGVDENLSGCGER
jgi:signal transduction histidine kinase